jgi:hypothetical protein
MLLPALLCSKFWGDVVTRVLLLLLPSPLLLLLLLMMIMTMIF